jgi:hypothetical protein
MHRRPTAVHMKRPRRRAHQRELRHTAVHGGRQRRVLEGQPHAAVGTVGRARATLPFVALDGRLEVVGGGEVVQFALHGVEILRVPDKKTKSFFLQHFIREAVPLPQDFFHVSFPEKYYYSIFQVSLTS